MNVEFKLDKWDIKLIKYLKDKETPTLSGMKKIWAERNAVDIEYIQTYYIVERMLCIVENLKLATLHDLVFNANPSYNWKCGLAVDEEPYSDTQQYFHCWARVLSSVLYLSKVKDLPGFMDESK